MASHARNERFQESSRFDQAWESGNSRSESRRSLNDGRNSPSAAFCLDSAFRILLIASYSEA